MANSALASYAILKVNWEQPDRRDYLDNFVLIIAEAIRQLPSDVVVLADVQRQVKSSFGLDIPQNIIHTLLTRVRRAGYINLRDRTYRKADKALAGLNFRAIQKEALEAYEALIRELRAFGNERYGLHWTYEQADEALLNYLELNQIILLSDLQAEPVSKWQSDPERQRLVYLVGRFIQQLQETQSVSLGYLETVMKGNLLANALFMTEPSTFRRRFRNTAVYFDAPPVVYALGYAGEPRKWPVLELINLLKKHGAELRLFRHSLEEIIGILSACAERIGSGQLRSAYGPSIEYFIEQGFSETDVMLFIETLETNLTRLGISVVDKPNYKEHEHVIDERRYQDFLREQVFYGNERALERDKDSIAAIVRLRRGEVYVNVEECRAVLVTANRKLAVTARRFEDFRYVQGTAPVALTDFELTTLVWLKDPTAAPSLPRRRLIADCIAATQPSDRLWLQYLEAIDTLEKAGKISADQYFLLRHSIQAKSQLMENTLGDERAFTEGTVGEVLKVIEMNIRAGDVARLNAETVAKQNALMKLEEERAARIQTEEAAKQREASQRATIRQRANQIARAAIWGIAVLLAVATAWLTFATSPLGPWNIDISGNDLRILPWIPAAVFLIVTIVQAASLVFGIVPKSLLDRLEPGFTEFIETWLLNERRRRQ